MLPFFDSFLNDPRPLCFYLGFTLIQSHGTGEVSGAQAGDGDQENQNDRRIHNKPALCLTLYLLALGDFCGFLFGGQFASLEYFMQGRTK